MKNKIKICYIDDNLEGTLSRYLVELCEHFNKTKTFELEVEFEEYQFQRSDNYKTLIDNYSVNTSNVIIIDSKLFENGNMGISKLTGEKFKIILKKYLPFIKTIVISSNETEPGSMTLQKHQTHSSKVTATEYYNNLELDKILASLISESIEELKTLEQLISDDEEYDNVLISSIEATISGIVEKNLFQKEDLDELINLFKEVKGTYGK